MPIYDIELENGAVLEIDADNEQAAINAASQYYAQQNLGQRAATAAAPPPEEGPLSESAKRQAYRDEFSAMPWYQRVLAGAGKTVDDTIQGARQLFGAELSSGEQSRLNAGEVGVHGGAATAGEIAGDLALFALPGGAAKILTRVPGATGRVANAVAQALRTKKGDIGLGVGMEGLKAENDTRSREGRMVSALFGGALGAGLTGVVGRILRGGAPTPAATNIMEDLNLKNLTPGQQSGGLTAGVERSMAGSVTAGDPTQGLIEQSMREWSDALRNRAASDAGFNPINPSSRSAWREIRQSFSDRYNQIWDADYPISPPQLSDYRNKLTAVADQAGRVGDADQMRRLNRLTTMLDNQVERALNGEAVPGRTIQSVQDSLKDEISSMYKRDTPFNRELMASLEDAAETVQGLLPRQVRDDLVPLNAARREFGILEDASGRGREGIVTPDTLQTALRGQSNAPTLAQGRERLQRNAEDASRVFTTDQNPSTVERVMNAVLAAPLRPFANPAMRDVLTGTTAPQKKVTSIVDALRLGDRLIPVTGARVGASVGAQERLAE